MVGPAGGVGAVVVAVVAVAVGAVVVVASAVAVGAAVAVVVVVGVTRAAARARRQADQATITAYVTTHPGQTSGTIARGLGWTHDHRRGPMADNRRALEALRALEKAGTVQARTEPSNKSSNGLRTVWHPREDTS